MVRTTTDGEGFDAETKAAAFDALAALESSDAPDSLFDEACELDDPNDVVDLAVAWVDGFDDPTADEGDDEDVAEAFGVDTDDVDPDDYEVPDALSEQVDLSEYKTAHGAAKAAGRKLKAIADEYGHKPDVEVTVEKRDGRFGEYWGVWYAAGEHDWAVRMTGGDAVYGGTDPLITGFYGNDAWQVECGSGTSLEFYTK